MRLIDADHLTGLINDTTILRDGFKWAFIAIVDGEPTVIPKPQWIPCSERLPDEKDAGILKKLGTKKRSDYVLATVEVKNERMTVTACTYDGIWDWNMKYAFPDYKIIAWMPLPESYREEGAE